jgi:hypothetical protein
MPDKLKCSKAHCSHQATFKVGGSGCFCLRHAQIELFMRVMYARTLGDYPLLTDLRQRDG